jgi:hypothetical protein
MVSSTSDKYVADKSSMGAPGLGAEESSAVIVNDPASLETISQAIYVLRLFENGMTISQLVEVLDGETSQAQAYFIFFSQMKGIEGSDIARAELGYWHLSEKGRETLQALTEE